MKHTADNWTEECTVVEAAHIHKHHYSPPNWVTPVLKCLPPPQLPPVMNLLLISKQVRMFL